MSTTFDQFVAAARTRFRDRFGIEARWVAAAPGRVNIIGEHVDYNDGFVLPMAIDRYCVILAADGASEKAVIQSAATNDCATINLSREDGRGSPQARHRNKPVKGHWSNYIAGVIEGCADRRMRPAGFRALIESRVPVGGGLSSSAALEVATATLVEAMTGTTLELVEKALLCQKAEHDFAGVPCGIMDQFASVLCQADHLMLLDCRSQQVEQIPFSDPDVTVLIINSNVKHELSGGEYAARRAQCESAARKFGVGSLRDLPASEVAANRRKLSDVEFRRARHVVGEIERTVAAAQAVKARDWPQVGQFMYASHESLRDDYEVSCRELDLLVGLTRDLGPKNGVFGSRMTGGGFGGCTVSLVETDSVRHAAQSIVSSYQKETGIEPSMIVSRPARGAHIVKTG